MCKGARKEKRQGEKDIGKRERVSHSNGTSPIFFGTGGEEKGKRGREGPGGLKKVLSVTSLETHILKMAYLSGEEWSNQEGIFRGESKPTHSQGAGRLKTSPITVTYRVSVAPRKF